MLKDLYDEVVKWQGKLMAWALGLEEFEDPALQNRTAADGEIAPVGSPEKTIMGKFSKFGYLPCKYLEARRIFQFVTGKYFATLDGVQQSYDQAMNLLILDRADKYKARYSAPFLMLMLGKDQTCYDFLKWYITVAPTYDFSNVDLPFLDIHNADPLESVDYIVRACPEEMDLSVLVAMYLIKMRLNLDQARIHAAVDEAMEKGNVTSQTLSDLTNANPIDMKNVLLTSSIVATNPFLHDYRALEPAQRQCQKLHVLIHCRNKHFFRMLFDKKRQWDREFLPNFLQNPTARGSEDEAYYVVKEAILAFAISDGALEITKLANRSLEGLQGEE
ncbi:hypothetical protein HK097_009785 [Rhizophlyctis rosea]|uniref:Uncharacterized protein n=1 Tax=Rhizophlyctis rosea TaxID=64517 RepID=A0AAD5X7L2_9FUNG|nr:hypothetical protein HK097_009785 [Rhizophlyctis rosea]